MANYFFHKKLSTASRKFTPITDLNVSCVLNQPALWRQVQIRVIWLRTRQWCKHKENIKTFFEHKVKIFLQFSKERMSFGAFFRVLTDFRHDVSSFCFIHRNLFGKLPIKFQCQFLVIEQIASIDGRTIEICGTNAVKLAWNFSQLSQKCTAFILNPALLTHLSLCDCAVLMRICTHFNNYEALSLVVLRDVRSSLILSVSRLIHSLVQISFAICLQYKTRKVKRQSATHKKCQIVELSQGWPNMGICQHNSINGVSA